MPLLWVCNNFRTDVYARFCRSYGLQVAGHTNAVRGMRTSWPVCLKQLDYPTQHLASELTIFVDIWSICSGHALDILSCAPYNGCAFPMVRKIKFYFNPPPPSKPHGDDSSDKQKIQVNISAFVRQIKQLAPMLREIGVSINLYSFDPPRTNDWWFDNLVTELFQVANRIEYESPSMATRMTLLPDQLYRLTHIHYSATINGGNEQILQLARQNSSTLQSLTITLQGITNISGLIQCPNGGYVSYPCLHTLKAKQWMNPGISQRPVFSSALPFPALRYLGIGYDYPFDDDSIFRRNAATLECLEMMLSQATTAMLNTHNVFTPSSHPRLKSVKLTQMSDLVPNQFASAAECMRFMLSIAPGASVREINIRSTGPELQSALLLFGEYASIQALALPGSRLSLWDAIDLIKSLPLLSDLLTLPPCLEPLPAGVAADNFLAYSLARFNPINSPFCCWQLGPHSSISSLETVECMLLLALICPSFGHVTPPIGDRVKFMAAMTDMVVKDKFKPHYPRLQRLLLDKWLKYR
ncbi:hypothetical protein LPJ71_001291 [Coemansia sp. S17]|nr:hypothetical protein LPJ71_001291 [Coemansia sp. S17]